MYDLLEETCFHGNQARYVIPVLILTQTVDFLTPVPAQEFHVNNHECACVWKQNMIKFPFKRKVCRVHYCLFSSRIHCTYSSKESTKGAFDTCFKYRFFSLFFKTHFKRFLFVFYLKKMALYELLLNKEIPTVLSSYVLVLNLSYQKIL